jgi:Mg2+-importing ATPase
VLDANSVDAEAIEQPRRWDIHFIRRFMLVFGIVSSLFDYLTFGVLLYVLHATPGQFRTGWFMESVISASLIGKGQVKRLRGSDAFRQAMFVERLFQIAA